jgi:CheY-like chemotaxis protein
VVSVEAAIRTQQEDTVLVVKDDPTLADMLRLLLKDEGWRISSAATAEEAVLTARGDRPDVVVLDLALPDSDGHYVLEELQADSRLREIPVIIASSRAYRPGEGDQVVGIFPEPVDLLEIKRLIARAAERSGARTAAVAA